MYNNQELRKYGQKLKLFPQEISSLNDWVATNMVLVDWIYKRWSFRLQNFGKIMYNNSPLTLVKRITGSLFGLGSAKHQLRIQL